MFFFAEHTVDVVGIAVGVSVAVFVLFVLCPIIIICVIVPCVIFGGAAAISGYNRCLHQPVVTTYPTGAPAATVVSARTAETSYGPKQEPLPPYSAQPPAYPAQAYPASGYPPDAAYPPQQVPPGY